MNIFKYLKALFSPIPCKECVLLAVCRSKLSNGNLVHLVAIMNECSIYQDYVIYRTLKMPNLDPTLPPYKKHIYDYYKTNRIGRFLLKGLNFTYEVKKIDPKQVMYSANMEDIFEMAALLKVFHNDPAKLITNMYSLCQHLNIKPFFPPKRRLR